VFDNLIYANTSVGISAGGNTVGTQGIRIINNTVYGHVTGVIVGTHGSQAVNTWLINNIIAASTEASIDVNAASRCSYVAAYNLITDPYSRTTSSDPTDLLVPSPFPNPAGPDGILGGAGFADDDFSLPQRAAGQAVDSPAVDAGAGDAVAFGLDQASTRSDGASDTGRVDLGFHTGNANAVTFSAVPLPLTVLYVRKSGDDENTGGTPSEALRSITRATQLATANTTIIVGPGTYLENYVGPGSLTPSGPVRFTADSTGDLTGDPAGPVLVDAQQADNGFLITGRCSTVIEGFLVRNAAYAGIELDSANDCVIKNNVVFSNYLRGIDVSNSDRSQVVNNLVYANGGGGIAVQGENGSQRVAIRNNTIYRSGADAIGIGLEGDPSTGARVEYNIMHENGLNYGRKAVEVGSRSLSGYVARYNINTDRYGTGTPQPVTDIADDPQFVAPDGADGVLGGDGFADDDFHLSQVAAGQLVTSAAVDYGAVTAKSLGLDKLSTRTDGAPDSGRVDLGYHYPLQRVDTLFVSPQGSDTNSGFAEAVPLRTIRTALGQATAGMEVRLASGYYAESGLRPAAGVSVIGSGDAPAQVDAGGASTAFDVQQPNVSIINVAVTGASSAGVRVQADGFELVASRAFSNLGKGIYVLSGQNTILFNNLVYLNGSTGVIVGSSTAAAGNASIVQNTIYGNGVYGITVGLGDPAPPPSTGAAIVNNVLAANGHGLAVGAGSLSGLIVSHNCNSNGYVGLTKPPLDISSAPLLVDSSGAAAGTNGSGSLDGGLFLSQRDAGQPADSPCVDVGLALAANLGLADASTRTDGAPDRGQVDIGYHTGLPEMDAVSVSELVRTCTESCNAPTPTATNTSTPGGGGGGCSISQPGSGGSLLWLLVPAAVVVWRRRR
jgi:parallel beta-helix repeat protein